MTDVALDKLLRETGGKEAEGDRRRRGGQFRDEGVALKRRRGRP